MSVELNSLLGYTWYAVYASITSNVNTVGLFSTITYFRTLTRNPDPVLNLHGVALSQSSIELMWQAPSRPNGVISNYLIYYAPLEDRLPVGNSKLLCSMKGPFDVYEFDHFSQIIFDFLYHRSVEIIYFCWYIINQASKFELMLFRAEN